jgi:putative membrane protein
MMYYGDHLSGWGWFGMALGMVLFWGLIAAAIVVLVRWTGQSGGNPGDTSTSRTPEDLLAERFARGEIDETEYRGRLGTLRGKVLR